MHGLSQDAGSPWTTPAAPLEDGRIVMQVNGDEDTYVKQGEDYIESGARAYDKKEGFLTDGIKTSGSVDTSTTGDYDVTYTVRNSENMESSITRTVHVVDDMDVDDDGISVLMYHYVYDEGKPPAKMDARLHLQHQAGSRAEVAFRQRLLLPVVRGAARLPRGNAFAAQEERRPHVRRRRAGLPRLRHAAAQQVPRAGDVLHHRKRPQLYREGLHVHERVCELPVPHLRPAPRRQHEQGQGRQESWDLDQASLEQDCNQAIAQLRDAQSLAYPYGDCPDFAPAALEDCGYLCAFTVQNDQVRKGDNPYKLPRVRMFGSSALEGFEYQVQHGIG